MFLSLSSQAKDYSAVSLQLVLACYRLAALFPPEARGGAGVLLKTAALQVHLNITEGASTKLLRERRKHFKVARTFLFEVDLLLDIARYMGYIDIAALDDIGEYIFHCSKIVMTLPERSKKRKLGAW